MTDYSPIVEPIGWDPRYSVAFCTFLGICAAAQTVVVAHPVGLPAFTQVGPDNNLQTRAGTLMRRELVARLATGSKDYSVDAYDRLAGSGQPAPRGQSVADEFAFRGAMPNYYQVGGVVNRFSTQVPRASGLETVGLFDRDAAIAAYQAELAAVLAALPQLVADLATQTALNTAQGPTAATTVAAAVATARAAYVTQLQAAYPTRGYA